MIAEYLHARLGVRIVRGLELEPSDAELLEELVQRANEIAQREPVIGDNALDLMELGEVRRVQGLVAEHSVNTEIFHRPELALQTKIDSLVVLSFSGENKNTEILFFFLRRLYLLHKRVQHTRAGSCRVSAQQILLRLLQLPIVPVA